MKTLYFSKIFLSWYSLNRRPLPWRINNNPYNVWIAEIIFQQTRIKQGLEYYNNFISQFPDINSLASAKEEEVLKLWQGLGYYSRARNLLASAKNIVYEQNGIFPSTYNEIKKLKGIGDYTAAAIASVVFNEPVVTLDGNVFRVLSRIFAINLPIDSPEGKRKIKQIAEDLIDPEQPGDFNQAVMEFGALQCTPIKPDCLNCPFRNDCLALKTNSIELYPVKSKIIKITIRYFNYLIIDNGKQILFRKRIEKDIWKNLYDFPLIETSERILPEQFINSKTLNDFLPDKKIVITRITDEVTHQLSHQKIIARFYFISLNDDLNFDNTLLPIDKKNILALPVPKIIENLLKVSSLDIY